MLVVSKKIFWVTGLILDFSLSKTTHLEITTHLSRLGHHTVLFGVRSRKTLNSITSTEKSGSNFNLPHFIFIPIRFVPIIAPVIHALLMTLLLPVYIVYSSPDFVIMSSNISVISSLPLILISKLRKTKLILDIRSTPVEIAGFRGNLAKFWFNISILIAKKFYSGITIITPMMKREISKRFSINQRRIGVWSSGVSTKFFDPRTWEKQGDELKRDLRLIGKFVVLYHGSFHDKRGLNETVDAIKIVSRSNPEIVFFLLGSGSNTLELKSKVEEENIKNNVIIQDRVEYENVPKYIAMCDVGIVPLPDISYWRSQSPLKLLEYLAMKKVVILTDLPAHRSVIGKEKCGIYISSTEPLEIAEAIKCAWLNKERLENWGKIGREIVKKKFSWELVSLNLEEYLLTLN